MSCPSNVTEVILEAAAHWVARLQERHATESDFAAWQEWLSEDPLHGVAYEQAEEVWGLAGQVKPAPWPTREELHAEQGRIIGAPASAISKAKPARRRNWQRHLVGGLLAAGFAAAVILVGARWMASPLILETSTAEQRSVRLEDGSRVTLAGETRLRVEFGHGDRRLELERGEAYFEVAHDRAHPFIVKVGDHQAVAVGTAFNVDANAGQMTVTVTEGVVNLEPVGLEMHHRGSASIVFPAPSQVVSLAVGERAETNPHGAVRLAALSNPERAIAWRDGRLEYLHESLRVVLHDVNRYTEHKIELRDPTIGDMEFTGTVFLDQLDAWLSALADTFPVEIQTRGGSRWIQRHPDPSRAVRGAAAYRSAPKG